MRKAWQITITVVEFLLGLLLLVSGIATIFSPTASVEGVFAVLYGTRASLVAFGVFFAFAGATLLYGKFRRRRKAHGYGLMLIYLSFLFAGIITLVTFNIVEALPNLIFAALTGALWLRWKFKTEYIQSGQFTDDIVEIRRNNGKP